MYKYLKATCLKYENRKSKVLQPDSIRRIRTNRGPRPSTGGHWPFPDRTTFDWSNELVHDQTADEVVSRPAILRLISTSLAKFGRLNPRWGHSTS